VIHATAECEREWIRNYLPECETKIAVVPNGVELPGKNELRTQKRTIELRTQKWGNGRGKRPLARERRTPNAERRTQKWGEENGALSGTAASAERAGSAGGSVEKCEKFISALLR
jgi:hypothetical protein